MKIQLELHPRWSYEWDIAKREKATLALCTHLRNSIAYTTYGFQTDIIGAEPVYNLGASERFTGKDKILLTLDIQEV